MTHQHWWHRVSTEYADGRQPLGSYLQVLVSYGGFAAAAAGGLALFRRRTGRRPEVPGAFDLLLLSVATHKIARLLAKDPVTSPLRSPFVRFAGVSGEAELAEEVRGDGLQRTIGELVTCPFCLGQWVASAFSLGYAVAPRATRLVAGTLTQVAVADFLQLGYATAQRKQQQA